jgi:ArsR family transcriptional regulator
MFAAADEEFDDLTHLFRALSDPTRLRIIALLRGGEKCVGQLCAELDAPQPTVSHHLAVLKGNAILARRRQGKNMFYSLREEQAGPTGDTGTASVRTPVHTVRVGESGSECPWFAAAAGKGAQANSVIGHSR